MHATTFFTALAPMAAIHGSRDPLGLQPLWSRMGRTVVVNVTTVSGDLRGWTTLLLCTGLVRSLIDDGHVADKAFLDAFLRAEQLVAYSRITANGGDAPEVRGVLGAKAVLTAHPNRPVPLGQSRDARILGNQAATGVWGQIASPARAAKLLDTARLRLDPRAEEFVDKHYLTVLRPHRRRLIRLLRGEDAFDLHGRDADLVTQLATLHGPVRSASVRDFYRQRVLWASRGADGVQARLATLLKEPQFLRHGINRVQVRGLAQTAQHKNDTDLAGRMSDIATTEALLAPCELLFGFLLGRHGQRLETVIAEIGRRWQPDRDVSPESLAPLRPHLLDAYGGDNPEPELAAAASALRDADWATAVDALLALNARIMRRRNGSPWIAVDRGRLDVRLQDRPADLPDDHVRRQWVHSYYLDPLRRLVLAVEGGDDAEA